jgi:hypothetical protein
VLALLALASCYPALAQARVCDAAEIQYGPCGTIPNSGVKGKHPNSGGGVKSKSTPDKPPQGGGEAESPGTGTENEDQGKHAGGAGPAGGGDGKGPGGGGSPGDGGSQGAQIGLGQGRAPGGGSAAAGHPTHGNGGSSPLVPVLIAVAVLAAISIGTVIYRQRRQIPVG